jgi:hypothetical protein
MNLEFEWEDIVVPAAPIKEQGRYRCAAWSPEAEFYGYPPTDRATPFAQAPGIATGGIEAAVPVQEQRCSQSVLGDTA